MLRGGERPPRVRAVGWHPARLRVYPGAIVSQPDSKGSKGRSSEGLRRSPLFDDAFLHRLERLALVARRRASGGLWGRQRAKRRGSGIEFADHRAYIAGDDLRALDVPVYQRFGRLLIRLFEEEEDLSVQLLLDCSGSMTFGGGHKFDQARRLCAALAYISLARLDRVAIHPLGGAPGAVALPTGRGKARMLGVLRYLEACRSTGPTDLLAALRPLVQRPGRRGIAVLVSDLYDPSGFAGPIDALRYARLEPYVLHLVQPVDQELPDSLLGDAVLADCETDGAFELTVTESVLRKARQATLDFRSQAERYCLSRAVSYAAFPSDVPFDEGILQLMRRGRLLG